MRPPRIDPAVLLTASAIVLVGATLQGAVGFGLGLFAVPLLILLDPRLVPAPLLMGSVWLTLLLAHREWHAIRFRDLEWALAGRVVGIGLAAAALVLVPPRALGVAFGGVVLAAVALTASGLHLRPTPRTLLGAGIASGLMATTVSIGGPPMALLYQHASGPSLRGTLSAFFVVGIVLSLTGLLLIGRLGMTEVRLGVALLPGVTAGFFLSRKVAAILDAGYTRRAVLLFSTVTGLLVMLKYLFWFGG